MGVERRPAGRREPHEARGGPGDAGLPERDGGPAWPGRQNGIAGAGTVSFDDRRPHGAEGPSADGGSDHDSRGGGSPGGHGGHGNGGHGNGGKNHGHGRAEARRGDDQPHVLGPLDPGAFVVPDTIAELEAEVRAYHREQRARTRRSRLGRLAHDGRLGLVLPLVVVLALLLATYSVIMLTFVPKSQHPVGVIQANPTVPAGERGGLLPDLRVLDADGAKQPIRSLRPAVILLLPTHCDCAALTGTVASQADKAAVDSYGIGTSLPTQAAGSSIPARALRSEPTGQLLRAYGATTRPMILLVANNGVVTQELRSAPPGDVLSTQLADLATATS